MVKLVEVHGEKRSLLWNILQKYLYEMTAYYDDEMDEAGNYRYEYFDAYFSESTRKALLIYSDMSLAGFAMINKHSYIGESPDYVLAEFCIFPMFRRHHVAWNAAMQIFKAYGTKWEVKYSERNIPAKCLWRKVTSAYNPRVLHTSVGDTVLAFRTI